MLGEHAPPLTVQLKDAGGNEVPAARPLEGLLLTMQTPEGAGDPDLHVQADQVRLQYNTRQDDTETGQAGVWQCHMADLSSGRWSCIWLAAVGSRQGPEFCRACCDWMVSATQLSPSLSLTPASAYQVCC